MSKTEFTLDEFTALGEGTLWPRFLLFPAVALVGYVALIQGWGGNSLPMQWTWCLMTGYCWFCVAGSFHESVHQTLGKNRPANIWFGRIVGTLLVIPYTAYRETHIRHHAYMNTADDFELWPYSKPGKSLAFRRAFVLFDLFAAVISNPFVYGRIYFARRRPLNTQAKRAIFWEYMAIIAVWGSAIATAGVLAWQGTIDVAQFNPIWVLPLVIASTLNGFRKLTEHLGMSSTDPILGTRTVIGDGWLTRLSSYFNFELFVHGPHHRYPKAPGFELQQKLAEFQQRHPDVKIPLFKTYRAALWDLLPCLWWNPGVGANAGGQSTRCLDEGVENFTSEVSQVPDESRRVA